MNLNTMAKPALIGLVYIYAAKLIDTIYPGLFRPAAFAGIIVGLNILAGAAQFVFFIFLYKYIESRTGKKWQLAGILAIIGSAVSILPKFLALAVLLQPQSLFSLIRHGNQIGIFCPWLSTFLLLSFAIIFLADRDIRRDKILKRSFTAGFAGWFVMFISFSFVLINYLNEGRLVLLFDFIGYGTILFVITSTTTFICLLIFYNAFISADFSKGTLLQVGK